MDGAVAVSGVGDLDGDGHRDILVGAAGEDTHGAQSGAAYLVYGPISGTSTLPAGGAKLLGEDEDDYAGHLTAAAGDINGDSYADLLIGAPFSDLGGDSSGVVYLVIGGP
jgi:hypothetical protein